MWITAGIRQALHNVAWLMLSKILAYVTTGLASIVVARVLGPEKTGLIAWTMSVVIFADTIAFLGMDPILFKHFTRRPGGSLSLLRTALQWRFTLASLCYLLLGGYVWFSYAQGKTDHLLLLVGALQLFTHYGYLVSFWFHARVQAAKVVRWEIPAALFSSGMRIAVVLMGYDVYSVVSVLIVSQLLESLGITLALVRDSQFRLQAARALRIKQMSHYTQWGRQRFTRNSTLLLAHGWPFLFVSLTHFIYMRIDQVMLPALNSRKETGFYAAAAILAEIPYQMSILITQSVLPGLLKLQRLNSDLYRTRMIQFFGLMIWPSLAITAALWFIGPGLIGLLFGPTYAPSSIMFQTLVLGLPFMFCNCMIGPWVLAHNLQRQYSLMLAIAALLNVLLNWFWIPIWGGVGAASASVLAYMVIGLGCPMVYRSYRPILQYIIRGLILPLTVTK